MAKPGIREIHSFISVELRKELMDRYTRFRILSEGDLQSHVWQLMTEYMAQTESRAGLHIVFNKLYIKEMGIFPDIVIFRRNKPWIFIELKESKRLKQRTADRMLKRFLKIRSKINIKRGYLLYLCRYGAGKVIKHKGTGNRWFYEIPIVLEDTLTRNRIREWEAEFIKWAKYRRG